MNKLSVNLGNTFLIVLILKFLLVSCNEDKKEVIPDEDVTIEQEAILLTKSGYLHEPIEIQLKNIKEEDIFRICIGSTDNIFGIGGCTAIKDKDITFDDDILSFKISGELAERHIMAGNIYNNGVYIFIEREGFEEIVLYWEYEPFVINSIKNDTMGINNDSLILNLKVLRPSTSFFLYDPVFKPYNDLTGYSIPLRNDGYSMNDTVMVLKASYEN
ncbi:MAG: hypothetical protein R3321_13555, partial [Nitrososphaeraceae archaeon]|nr:hypothetical protein [Nitrososphaeraceae archaeon]